MSLVVPHEATIKKNIKWNIGLIATQVRHADDAQTRAKSGYYKLSVLLCASAVEALLYILLSKKIGCSGVLKTEKKHFESSAFPSPYIPTGEDWVMCKRRDRQILLSNKTDFIHLSEACLEQHLISKKLFEKVKWIRTERNKIHLHGLNNIERRCTMKDLERASSVMNELLKKVT